MPVGHAARYAFSLEKRPEFWALLLHLHKLEGGQNVGIARQRKLAGLDAPSVLGDVRTLSQQKRQVYGRVALERAKAIADSLPQGAQLYAAFAPLLRRVVEAETIHWGACHDTSAVLYMRLLQTGVQNVELLIGEVHFNGERFDHSWVEVNEKVFDVAICAPNPDRPHPRTGELIRGGCFAGGPVFAGIDLGLNSPMLGEFGVPSEAPLDSDAKNALDKTLQEFFAFQKAEGCLTMASIASEIYGVDGHKLVEEHKDVRRRWRNAIKASVSPAS